jgi:hypothetical protein
MQKILRLREMYNWLKNENIESLNIWFDAEKQQDFSTKIKNNI